MSSSKIQKQYFCKPESELLKGLEKLDKYDIYLIEARIKQLEYDNMQLEGLLNKAIDRIRDLEINFAFSNYKNIK